MLKYFQIPIVIFVLMFPVFRTAVCQIQDGITITGKVIGTGNLPLSGVYISIEGIYTEPVITDTTGVFEITAPDGYVWLMITPAENYKTRRVYLNNRKSLTMKLTPEDLESGDDEVINLFKTGLRRNMISSYHAPDPDDAYYYPHQSIDQFLQFSVPGLLSTGFSGMPGSGTVSFLRGIKSLYTSNQPLYIVDGLPIETPGLFRSQLDGNNYNPISGIDPQDITNITFLKDFMETSIYGMRASNGVVLIETLKPTEVETTIDFSYRTGISLEPDQIPQMNARQYKTLAYEVLNSSERLEEEYKEQYTPLYSTHNDKEHYKYMNNTNWQDLIFSNALMNDFYMRVRGGDEIARYGLSVSYLKHQGIINTTMYDRFNIRFVGTFNIFQWLRMYINSNLNTAGSNLKESALNAQTNPILTGLSKSPLLIPYQFDEEGRQLITLENVGPLGVSNPLAVIEKFEGKNENNRFTTSFRIEGEIIGQNLKWNSLLGLNFNSLNESIFMPNRGMDLYYDKEAYNVAKSLKNYLYSIYNDNFLSYHKEIGNKHSVNAAAGFRINTNRYELDWAVAKNSHESDEYKQLQNGISSMREKGGENSRWNRLAVYGTAGYGFADKYFLQANLTAENSTRIGKNAKDILKIGSRPFGMFYSFGGAWRVSGEPLLRDLYWLEDLKLRASYGVTGNDDIGNISSLDYYIPILFRETTGMIPGPLSEQKLKFELVKQLNTGLDISLLGNRLRLSVDLYNIKTEDLLVFEPQDFYIGYATVPSNLGILSNKGQEVSFFFRILEKGKFRWDAGLNITRLKNTIDDIRDGQVIFPFAGGEFISSIGEPVLSFYGFEYMGVFSTTEQAEKANLTNEKGMPFLAGDAIFNDRSGPDGEPDGVINEYDKTFIGSPIPDYFGNIRNLFRWRRWSFSAIIQFVDGNEVFNYVRSQDEKMTDLANQSTYVLNRWFYEGQVTDVPRASWNDPVGNASFSTRWIENGSYLRIKNLTLSYTIPEKFLFFRNAQVFVTATNLYTFHRYLGYDPEFSYSNYTMEQGIDYGLMPHTQKFLMGIKVGL